MPPPGFAKPFVYLSEAVLTDNNPIGIINRLAPKQVEQVGCGFLNEVWTRAALSVKSQATLHRSSSKYKAESLREWLRGVVDQMAQVLPFDVTSQRDDFRKALSAELVRPQNYRVPEDTQLFLDSLATHNINWGVISNSSYLYPMILRFLGLSPFTTVMAQPNIFKPLPEIMRRAISRTPRDSRHNIWFIGSALHPCDNMVNDAVRCALISNDHTDVPFSGNAPQHFKVKELRELQPFLFSFPSIDWMEQEPMANCDEEDDVVLVQKPRNKVLPLGKRERALGELKEKPKVL